MRGGVSQSCAAIGVTAVVRLSRMLTASLPVWRLSTAGAAMAGEAMAKAPRARVANLARVNIVLVW
jgi:hypothetical protein